jgi:hypothetical protein
MTHVRLCERPVRWSFDVNASTRVFYDGLHQEVVVLSGGQCYTSDFHSATLFDRHIRSALVAVLQSHRILSSHSGWF